MKQVFFLCAIVLPAQAQAFCGGWDSPVAFGFDHSSWADRWPILGAILLFVALFSTLIIRQVRNMRDMPLDEA